jgi:hypothetical protein
VILALALLASCKELDPETGDLRPACVDRDSDPGRDVSFAKDIRPLMNGDGAKGCKGCHYPTNFSGTREGFLETGLNLETLGALRRGGRNTNAGIVVPGSPCNSAIVKKLQGTFGGARMPKGGPYWRPDQIQLVVDWIAEGARGEDAE